MTSSQDPTLQDACPARRSDLTVRELDGEALIFDPQTQNTHRLNGTAWFIFAAFDGKTPEGKVVEELVRTFDIDEAEARDHVNKLHNRFDGLGLLEADSAGQEA